VSHWQDFNVETWFTIDDQAPVRLYPSGYHGSIGSSEYDSPLSGLSEGSHVIKVWASGEDSYNEGRVFFTVDSTAPTIDYLSIKNTTYSKTNLELNYTTNEPFSWVAYCIDDQANVTIKTVPYYIYALGDRISEALQGDITLANLTEGSHSLTVYANDTAGNMGASQVIFFTVDEPEPFPAKMMATALAIGLAVAATALAYRRHRRKRKLG
jgi:hypothetical protein